jgi:DNA-binding protein Fis
MKKRRAVNQEGKKNGQPLSKLEEALEESLGKTLEELVTCLYNQNNQKNKLYEELIAMTDRALLKIALRRCGKVKTAAAGFLGINRNTLTKKLTELGLE